MYIAVYHNDTDELLTEINIEPKDYEKYKVQEIAIKKMEEDVNNWVKWVYENFENFYIKSPDQILNSEYNFLN